MSNTGEDEAQAAEQQTAEAPPAVEAAELAEQQQPQEAVKPLKEKRKKVPKEKQPRKAKSASHPPYFQMIQEAITALNEKSSSSPYAIAKYIEEKHKPALPANFRKILALQLKNSVVRGKLIKIKASYKLSEAAKQAKAATKIVTRAARANAAVAGAEPKQTRSKKKKKLENINANSTINMPKAVTAGRSTRKSVTAKPKQPKSIKSSAAKKAKKVAT